ncbi:DNA-3-methyladenine glycosylase 2 [Deinococcus radiotolerans]|nr:Ada metal-binding domain-containing protein [Deinococcus radiotolerans]
MNRNDRNAPASRPPPTGAADAPVSLPYARDFMLGRMFAADAAFDGLFYTGVTSTGIYCLPSCRARKPRAEHVQFHATPLEARAAGLRACRRCHPDAYRGVPPHEAALMAALGSVHVPDVPDVRALAAALHLGESALHAHWRALFQVTPGEWLARERVRLAARALRDTGERAAAIAFGVGFGSLSAFGAQFRRVMHLTPQAWRVAGRNGGLTLTLPAGVPLAVVWRDLSRDPRSVTQRVDAPAGRLTFAWTLPTGPQRVALHVTAGKVEVHPDEPDRLSSPDWEALHALTVRALGLHTPQTGRGWPVPLAPQPFDGLIWAVAAQQVTFAQACRVRRTLTERHGTPVAGDLIAPPTAAQLSALNDADLRAAGLTDARAALMRRLAGRAARHELNLDALARGTVSAARRTLLAVPGIGPWTAEYVLLRVLGFPDIVPDGDAALAASLRRTHALPTKPTPAQVQALLLPHAPRRSQAVLRAWHAALDRT